MDIPYLHSLFLKCNSVSTDTRKISDGSMFFALKGENFNGNLFAEKAIEAGALYAIVDEKRFENPDKNIFLVQDSLKTLQDLAKYHREQLTIPIISLTGSNGKTTTKELMTAVLKEKYKVAATLGNLNNHIGVPLTLLSIKDYHQIVIVEMGANHQKEIEFLSNIAQPDYGYITNFGKAHLEGFGGIDGIIKGKSELYTYLRINSKKVFINTDDKKQMGLSEGMNRTSFGQSGNPDYRFEYGESIDGKCPDIIYGAHVFKNNLTGEYNLPNIAAAIATGLTFGVTKDKIKYAIENYTADNNRSQIIKKGDTEILLDAYNANPSSMEAALINFSKIKGSKTVILGDMFELGTYSHKEHQIIADLTIQLKFEEIFLIGELFNDIIPGRKENIKIFRTRSDAENYFSQNKINTSHILIKGSRGMALEKLLDQLSL